MGNLWIKLSTFGPVSLALGSLLWSQKTEANHLEITGSGSPYELKLVQVLFRHGARTPLKSIPDVMEVPWMPTMLEPPPHTLINYVVTDLHGGPKPKSPIEDQYRSNRLTGGCFPGQLTTLGMQQLYELGRRMRRRYVEEADFLGSAFSSAEVYVRSTNIVRTIESARCLVAGLFQQEQNDIVPILTTDAESEILYPNYLGCKMLKFLSGQRWAVFVNQPDVAADLESIKSALGIAAHQHADFVLMRDDMVARETHGLACPPELETWRDIVEQRAIEMMYYVIGSNDRAKLQLCVGRILHMMLANMEEKLHGTSAEANRKLFLYSAHDTTLIPYLMALGIFDMIWPPFAADITVELHRHRQTDENFVKVSYMGQDQLIPGCSGVYCPLEEFKQVISACSMSPELYKSHCDVTLNPQH